MNNQVKKRGPESKISAGTNNNMYQKFIEKLLVECYRVQDGEITWEDVSKFAKANGLDMSPDYIRQGSRLLLAARTAGLSLSTEQSVQAFNKSVELGNEAFKMPTAIETNPDGSSMHQYTVDADRLVALFEGGCLSEAKVREFFGIPEDIAIERMKYQAWHSALKGGGKQIMYNIRVDLRPKTSADFSLEDINAFFERNASTFAVSALPAKAAFKPKKSKKYAEIDLADIHFGLLAWANEVGKSYDLHIARKRVLMVFEEFVDRHSILLENGDRIYSDFEFINIALMGDILHVDNGNMETAHGTRQDVEGRIPKMIDTATKTLVDAIQILEQMQCPIKVTYVPGNHDTYLGYSLVKILEAVFKDDENVTFDTTPKLFKAVKYGCTLVGLSHGEMPNKRAHTAMITEFKKEFGACDNSEVHLGHLHSESAGDYVGGVMVYRVPAICESSFWEKSKAYPAMERGTMVFIYDANQGRIGIEYYQCEGIQRK